MYPGDLESIANSLTRIYEHDIERGSVQRNDAFFDYILGGLRQAHRSYTGISNAPIVTEHASSQTNQGNVQFAEFHLTLPLR